MADLNKKPKRSRVKLPWWGWVLVGLAVVFIVLPSLFSEDPLGIGETYGGLWGDLQRIGEALWFFAGELASGFSGPSE
ncbi:MAG: hypothetical protein K9G09_05545 [Pontimonas sp.]|nr:hypothetical protein [Pontimonas sp.]